MKNILVYFGTDKHSSPYDILFAHDTGFDVILPYNNVKEDEITALIQDCMFARGEEGVRHTTVFFGGSDTDLVDRLAKKARDTMFPPYQLSIIQDPEGAYTTAAALVAKVTQALLIKNERIEGKKIVILGGTGPVGKISGGLLIGHGADVTISSRTKRGKEFYHSIIKSAEENRIEGIDCGLGSVSGICTKTSAELPESAADAQIILSTSHPGIEMLKEGSLIQFKQCLAAADISAVQPLGIADIGSGNDLKPIGDILTLGGLTIGRLKSKTAVEMMNYAGKNPGVYMDCKEAFVFAQKLLLE